MGDQTFFFFLPFHIIKEYLQLLMHLTHCISICCDLFSDRWSISKEQFPFAAKPWLLYAKGSILVIVKLAEVMKTRTIKLITTTLENFLCQTLS